MEKLLFSDALTEIWVFIRRLNKFADECQPWFLAKDLEKRAELAGVMYVLAEGLRFVSILISPFMPDTPKLMRAQLGIADEALAAWDSAKAFGSLPDEISVVKGDAIFPRIDLAKELKRLEDEAKPEETEAQAEPVIEAEPAAPAEPELPEGIITIEDFAKVKLQVGLILECEKVKKSDKLLKSQIKVGERVHQVVSGIAKWYSPEDMVGKRVVVVSNLKPVKLKGVLSEGMLLAAANDAGELNLVTVDGSISDGSEVR
jgi:methionyl-tRNA synthetase